MKKICCTTLPENLEQGAMYRVLPKLNPKGFYEQRTDRNIGWITREEQSMIKTCVVGIAGCGGMGGLVAATLLRLGVGEIRITDTEVFDVSNINRQFAARKSTIGRSKAISTLEMLRDIADDTVIEMYPEGINEDSVEDFVQGCDIICDEIEFWAVGSRILLHQSARRQGITVFNSPTVGHSVYLTQFTPCSMCIEEVLGLTLDEARDLQHKIQIGTATPLEITTVMSAMLSFAAPVVPEYSTDTAVHSTLAQIEKRLLNETRASIIATNPPMASGFLANQVLFFLLQKSCIKRNFVLCPPMPGYLMFDAALMECKVHYGVWWNYEQKQQSCTVVDVCTRDSFCYQDACAFVRKKYLEQYGTMPKDLDTYIIAKKDGVFIGTMGFETPSLDWKLSVPGRYTFEEADLPFVFNNSQIAQCSRWTSDGGDISIVMVYALALYAKAQNKTHVWAEQVQGTNKILVRAGVNLVRVDNAQLVLQDIPDGDRAYYEKRKPMPYLMDVEQVLAALSEKMSAKIQEKILIFSEVFGLAT